jgi:hypothetical protein
VAIGEAAVQHQASDPFRVLSRVGQRHRRPHREPEQVDPAELEVVDHRPEHLQVAVERLGCRPGVGEPTARLVVGHHGPAGGDRGVEGAHGRVLPGELQVTDPGGGDDQRGTSSDDRVRHPHARGRDDKADRAALIRFARLAPHRVDHRHPPWIGGSASTIPFDTSLVGKRLSGDGTVPTGFRTVENRTTSTGVVALTLRTTGTPPKGEVGASPICRAAPTQPLSRDSSLGSIISHAWRPRSAVPGGCGPSRTTSRVPPSSSWNSTRRLDGQAPA